LFLPVRGPFAMLGRCRLMFTINWTGHRNCLLLGDRACGPFCLGTVVRCISSHQLLASPIPAVVAIINYGGVCAGGGNLRFPDSLSLVCYKLHNCKDFFIPTVGREWLRHRDRKADLPCTFGQSASAIPRNLGLTSASPSLIHLRVGDGRRR
jgi:hypothetical protein